jgi:hypothetical protein
MARKRKTSFAATRTSDEVLIRRLRKKAPETLRGELDFDAIIAKILPADSDTAVHALRHEPITRQNKLPS